MAGGVRLGVIDGGVIVDVLIAAHEVQAVEGAFAALRENGVDVVADQCAAEGQRVRAEIRVAAELYLERGDVEGAGAFGLELVVIDDGVVGGDQHIDNHTTIDHAKPHAASHELYKGILEGHSTAVFNGKILVRKDAQKTDAKQTNKNLVLSEESVINTKPELQIHADDVRCTHGATIGQLDAEGMFYLQSRGIGKVEARNLLIVAFARDIVDRIKVEPLRDRLEKLLLEKLHGSRN